MSVFWMAFCDGAPLPWSASSRGPHSVHSLMSDKGRAWLAEQAPADICIRRVRLEPFDEPPFAWSDAAPDTSDTPITAADFDGILSGLDTKAQVVGAVRTLIASELARRADAAHAP